MARFSAKNLRLTRRKSYAPHYANEPVWVIAYHASSPRRDLYWTGEAFTSAGYRAVEFRDKANATLYLKEKRESMIAQLRAELG